MQANKMARLTPNQQELLDIIAEFIDKNDGGIRQIQIKGIANNFQNNLLESYYGLQ